MYRPIHPTDQQELALRMLFHPVGDGVFQRACEADSFRGLVAALLDDPGYEQGTTEGQIITRIRMAEDARLLAAVTGRTLVVGDRDDEGTINVASDEFLIRSLDRVRFVSLPGTAEDRSEIT